jgi:thiamine transport system substrate-binding protein
MKQRLTTLIMATVLLPAMALAGCSREPAAKSLNVYCYDSFSSEWGPGPALAAAFEKETGIKIIFSSPGDAGAVLAQLIAEKGNPRADVVIGLDNAQAPLAFSENLLIPCRAENLKAVPADLLLDAENRLVPYDYGHFALILDTDSGLIPPASLEDLTKPEYAGKLILMDPRTSSPGLGFLLWTVSVYGDKAPDYWKRLQPSVLTVTDGWSQGYGLMLSGEAPLVISYGTSPVYHKEYEQSDRYKALEFAEGHMEQIEGMGLVRGSKKIKEGNLFINWLLGTEAQRIIATANIMLPVRPETELPASFGSAMVPAKRLAATETMGGKTASEWTDLWVETLTGNP